jgi:hypothetical protein
VGAVLECLLGDLVVDGQCSYPFIRRATDLFDRRPPWRFR